MSVLEVALKWITALDLEQWADSIPAQSQLSEIVSDLVRASAADIKSFRFPTRDSAQLHGYDGRLEAIGAPPYVPNGNSVWEFGVGKDYARKANQDYAARTENPGAATPNDTTFIFVTPRRWADQEQWVAKKKQESKWFDVRVIDAVSLEDWLDLNPAVAARTAREILHTAPQVGAQSTLEYWSEYATRFSRTLTEDVLIAGRDAQVPQLLQQLRGQPQSYIWQADSTEEVVAFAVAVIRKAEPDIRRYLESRTIIVDAEEAARQLATRQGLIFIPHKGARNLGGLLAQQHVTVVPAGRDDSARRSAVTLNRPTSDQLVEAMKTMGFQDEESKQLVRRCGRSVTILARQIPSVLAPKPEWDGQRKLIPALLAGGWNSRSDEDREAIRLLVGTGSYDEYEGELLPFLRMQDPPLDKEGDVWKVRAPMDALVHLGPLLGPVELARLRTVVARVFGEVDPTLELPPEERPFSGLRGNRLKHSEWIRGGLATTLLLISEFHEPARLALSAIEAKRYVSDLIGSLPGLDQDYRAIASLHGELSILMEAAPRPLLAALERLVEADGSKIRPIFRDTEIDFFYSSSPHTYLLWAMEMLAWDPAYLGEAALMLAKLTRIDPGGKLSNRPLESLREIFLPWHPSTNATSVQRLSALDQILTREQETGWNLIIKILPESHGIASQTAKPRYREAGASGRETVTYGLVAKGYKEIIDRALRLVGDDPQRWRTVIEKIDSFSPSDRSRTIELLEGFVRRSDDGAHELVWSALRDAVNHHRAFPTADWVMPDEDLVRLESILSQIQPSDTIRRVAWLFNDHSPRLPTDGATTRGDAVEAARKNAVQEIVRREGLLALPRLAGQVKYPGFVAYASGDAINDVSDVETLAKASLDMPNTPTDFIVALSADAERRFGEPWRDRVATLFKEGRLTCAQVTAFVMNWTEGSTNWDFVSSLGPEVEQEYWEKKPAWFVPAQTHDLETAVRKYLDVGRSLDAIGAYHYNADALPAELLFALLDKGMEALNAKPTHIRANLSYEIEQLFKSLRGREGVSPTEIARREYAYLPIFGYGEKILTIHSLMAHDPALFVSIVCDVFKPESGEPSEPTGDQIARAKAGYRLLSDFHSIPGLEGDQVDALKLENWVTETRRLAAIQDRARMVDEYIGHLLAHAPSDPDGGWPHRVVRDLIESVASEKLEQGIDIERFNMRGVTSRAPFEGGKQERALALQIREWATLGTAWPRTSALLERMALGWEREAEREDQEARQNAMRFE